MLKTEVVVIGGGATGAGVLRDLALRGIDAILLEKKELTSGTSGRNHGLLHSGARYAVNDPDSGRNVFQKISSSKKLRLLASSLPEGFSLPCPKILRTILINFSAPASSLEFQPRKFPRWMPMKRSPRFLLVSPGRSRSPMVLWTLSA